MLANRPDVDATRIGIVGHSYGGKWALFSAALWDRFACVAVSDAGIVFDETRINVNYWEPWYRGYEEGVTRCPGLPTVDNPRTGAYRRLVETGHDLHELLTLIAPRPLFIAGGSEDPPSRWTALNHVLAVHHILGYESRVGMSNRSGHAPTPTSNALIYEFMQTFLQDP